MRNIIVYKCDTCEREVQLQQNAKGIETVGKCIITQNCRGRLYVEKTIQTTSPFLQRTEEVIGLDNFYPRKKLDTFTQSFVKNSWLIEHNLETFPIISVYDPDGNIIFDTEYTIELIDKNTLTLDFTNPTAGTAQLYVREVSVNEVEAAVDTSTIVPVQVSTDLLTGTFAIATRLPRADVNDPDTITLKLRSATGQIQFTTLAVNKSNVNSPWSGITKVVIRNKSYYIGIVDFFSGGFNTSLISNGTTITVEASDQDVTHFMLADSPFERADLIKNRILEASKVNTDLNSLFFDNDQIFCDNNSITNIFPNLILS